MILINFLMSSERPFLLFGEYHLRPGSKQIFEKPLGYGYYLLEQRSSSIVRELLSYFSDEG